MTGVNNVLILLIDLFRESHNKGLGLMELIR